MTEEIPDKNIFMMCPSLNREALTELPKRFHIRNCRKDELGIWKKMPFDNPQEAIEYDQFMVDFFETVYGGQEALFYQKTLFVCDESDQPIATCMLWKAYQEFSTIHWLKVVKGYEDLGIGRAILSIIMKDLTAADYPVYLHTQPGSYRAIKLYSDFGFHLISDKQVGNRINELEECLPILKQYMPKQAFLNLRISKAPTYFLDKLKGVDTIEF